MEPDHQSRHRPPPAQRFAALEHRLDLQAIAEQLRQEPISATHGHRQMTVYHHPPMTVVLFVFEPGGQLRDHQANGVVTIHLLAGEVQVATAAQTYDLAPASMVALAPAVRHSVLAKQPSTMLLTVCLEQREDANG